MVKGRATLRPRQRTNLDLAPVYLNTIYSQILRDCFQFSWQRWQNTEMNHKALLLHQIRQYLLFSMSNSLLDLLWTNWYKTLQTDIFGRCSIILSSPAQTEHINVQSVVFNNVLQSFSVADFEKHVQNHFISNYKIRRSHDISGW